MTHQYQPAPPGPNRRKVILTGAGIAAAGVVVGAGVPLVGSQLSGDESGEAVAAPKEPVMIHLRNAQAGQFDVFVGTTRIQINDRSFASRLSSEVRKAQGR